MGLVSELRRRNVLRMAVLYVVAAWLIMQVAGVLIDLRSLPEWIGPIILPLLVIGFPIALIFSWFYELTPEGISLEKDVDLAESMTHVTGRRMDFVVIALMAAALIMFTYDKWWTPPPELSVAVLPFENMSADPDNSYFADGISEEILSGLSNVRGIRVSGRTSSFSLRDKDLDIRQIGRMLNVAFVVEGSVRVSGDRLRITAQLIDSKNDEHLWSDTYDRSMSDVFAVQDDIAERIVSKMQDTLNVRSEWSNSVSTTQNPEAYSYFLRARALVRYWAYEESSDLQNAINYLNSALELDPGFSDGYVALADAYAELSDFHFFGHRQVESVDAMQLAADAAMTAVDLAPNSSQALRVSALYGSGTDKWFSYSLTDEDVNVLRDVIRINPNNVEAYSPLIFGMIDRGALEEGLRLAKRFHEIDPLNRNSADAVAIALRALGRTKEASTYYRVESQLRMEVDGGPIQPSKEYLENIAKLPTMLLNLDFETHLRMKLQSACSDNFQIEISDEAYTGEESVHLFSLPDSSGWCNTVSAAPAEPYRGKFVRLTGMVKTRKASRGAALWLRVDGWRRGFILSFDNLWPNDINDPDTDWRSYELTVFVPSDAYVIIFGGLLKWDGEMWMDDFRFEVSDNPDFN